MGFHFIGLAMHDENPAPVGFPAGNPGRELLIGQNDALVVFVPKLVIDGVGTRVPPKPELLDEVLPFLVGLESFEGVILLGIDDVRDFVLEASSSERCRSLPFAWLAPGLCRSVRSDPATVSREHRKKAVRVRTVPLRFIGHLVPGVRFVVLTPAYHSIRGFRVNSWKFALQCPPCFSGSAFRKTWRRFASGFFPTQRRSSSPNGEQ